MKYLITTLLVAAEFINPKQPQEANINTMATSNVSLFLSPKEALYLKSPAVSPILYGLKYIYGRNQISWDQQPTAASTKLYQTADVLNNNSDLSSSYNLAGGIVDILPIILENQAHLGELTNQEPKEHPEKKIQIYKRNSSNQPPKHKKKHWSVFMRFSMLFLILGKLYLLGPQWSKPVNPYRGENTCNLNQLSFDGVFCLETLLDMVDTLSEDPDQGKLYQPREIWTESLYAPEFERLSRGIESKSIYLENPQLLQGNQEKQTRDISYEKDRIENFTSQVEPPIMMEQSPQPPSLYASVDTESSLPRASSTCGEVSCNQEEYTPQDKVGIFNQITHDTLPIQEPDIIQDNRLFSERFFSMSACDWEFESSHYSEQEDSLSNAQCSKCFHQSNSNMRPWSY